MDNAEMYSVFGMEPPKEADADTGEKAQESAVPAAEGEKAQEPAAPAAMTPDGQEPSEAMDKAQRTENARKRRQKEMDAAVEAARQQERAAADQRMKNLFAKAGLKTADGKPITTMEEFEDWDKSQKDAALQRDLKAGKLTREQLERLISESPLVQAAKASQEQAENDAKEARRRQFQQQVAQELTEIGKLDGSVKSLNDILALPTGRRFSELVGQHGLDYLSAFKLANEERLRTAAAGAAAVGARMEASGKGHLVGTMTRGIGMETVPEDVKANYRALRPDMSDEDIAKDYNKRK